MLPLIVIMRVIGAGLCSWAERVQSRLALTSNLRVGFIPLEFSFTENNTMPPLVGENAVTQFPWRVWPLVCPVNADFLWGSKLCHFLGTKLERVSVLIVSHSWFFRAFLKISYLSFLWYDGIIGNYGLIFYGINGWLTGMNFSFKFRD